MTMANRDSVMPGPASACRPKHPSSVGPGALDMDLVMHACLDLEKARRRLARQCGGAS